MRVIALDSRYHCSLMMRDLQSSLAIQLIQRSKNYIKGRIRLHKDGFLSHVYFVFLRLSSRTQVTFKFTESSRFTIETEIRTSAHIFYRLFQALR